MEWSEGEGLPENLKGLLEILEWWYFSKERVDPLPYVNYPLVL